MQAWHRDGEPLAEFIAADGLHHNDHGYLLRRAVAGARDPCRPRPAPAGDRQPRADDQPASSRRTIAAPAASARSFPKARSRGMYFMPQSGAGISRSAVDMLQAATDARGDLLGGLHLGAAEVEHAKHDLLA